MNLYKKKDMNLSNTSGFRNILGILLFFLVLVTACKKDKTETIKEPLKVTDYFPNSGNQGTLVTIQGTGFGNRISEVTASFSGTSADVVSVTPKEIVLRSPKGGSTGDISLKISGEQVLVGKYTYQELSVQSISPANGSAGAHIQITGAGFGSTSGPAQVFINGKQALVVSASDNLLVAEVPEAAGTGPVTVKVNGKEASGQTFKFQSITDIKPLTGGKGTKVRINGSGFDEVAAGNYVDFNGKQALVQEAAADHLIVIAPDEVATGPLSLTINNQKTTGPVFTVVPVPVIQTVSPLSGPAGAVMTITGTTFSAIKDENRVSINGKDLSITSATATVITLTLPGGTGSGKVVLSVNDQVVQGPDFKDQNLGIVKLSPDNGLAGTEVTITGSGFNASPSANTVTFNGVAAVVKSAAENTLVVVAPEQLSTGQVKITSNGQTAVSPTSFNRAGVLTFAGGPGTTEISVSRFGGGIVVDKQGNVYLQENEKNRIKKISPAGVVSLFAGSPSSQSGNRNGQGTDALFNFGPSSGMVIDPQGNLFVSDYGNQSVRKITPQGVVSTFAVNLTNFTGKITMDQDGFVYVQKFYLGVWKIDKDGVKTSLAQGTSVREDAQPAVVGNDFYWVDAEGTLLSKQNLVTGTNTRYWVGGNYGYQDGIGTRAMFSGIKGILSDGNGNMYVSDNGNNALRKVNISTLEVTTVLKSARGYKDGSLAQAQVNNIADMAVDKDGNIYILDLENNAIRKIFLR
ncbi:IPT/TIG domain-containing protein [Pedobacter nutrimenti]|nr:IPT/TIG domain-containing protein [Pedobacter nutrimenti]